MHQSVVASMEAGMQQSPAKKPTKSLADLLQYKKSVIKEWRFVQEGEDVQALTQDSFGKLNSED